MSNRWARDKPILTTLPARVSDAWRRSSFLVDAPHRLRRLAATTRSHAGRRLLKLALDMLRGVRLFCLRRRFEVVVTQGAGAGVVLAALQTLARGRRVPHVMIDCLWYRAERPLATAFQRLKMTILRSSVDCFIVWSSHEAEGYAREFMLPRERFVYVPFHHTLAGYSVAAREEHYIFSGGDSDRDYKTLVEAARGLPVRVMIAARRQEWLAGVELPPNVQVMAPSPSVFRQLMASAKLVVVPMRSGLLRSGGQQTYLNAMALAKPVVVADEMGAADYIVNGETGIIVPPGDAPALRTAIASLLADRDRAAALGRAGKKAASVFSTEATMKRTVELALAVARDGRRASAQPSCGLSC